MPFGPLELRDWRRRNGIGQAALGKHLGVTRETVSHWESGKHRMPADIEARLPASVESPHKPPEHVCPAVAPLYPGLDLYRVLRSQGRKLWTYGKHHPIVLLGALAPGSHYPCAVLESPEYKAALSRVQA